MNEIIKNLFIQAGGGVEEENGNLWTYSDDLEPELFGQLVVRECIKEITDQMFYEGIDESNNPGYYKAINRVEEHFGVEE